MNAELVKGLEFPFGEIDAELVKRKEFLSDHKRAELVKGLEFLFGEIDAELVKRKQFLLNHKRAEPVKMNQFTIRSSSTGRTEKGSFRRVGDCPSALTGGRVD